MSVSHLHASVFHNVELIAFQFFDWFAEWLQIHFGCMLITFFGLSDNLSSVVLPYCDYDHKEKNDFVLTSTQEINVELVL